MTHREELLQERRNLIARRKQLLMKLDELAPAYHGMRISAGMSTWELQRELNAVQMKLIANSAYLEHA